MKRVGALIAAGVLSVCVQASEGVLQVASEHGVNTTADKLEKILRGKGMTIMARVPHSDAASGVGVELRPTELLIFGNPKVGSPLMACEQRVALDLPQKALIYEDADGQTWIAYNDPAYLQGRHQITGCDQALQTVSGALAKLTAAAALAD